MPAPRKPSNVLELNGAFKRNPQRRRTGVKAPAGVVGEPPERFDEHQRTAWTDIVRDAPLGVLKASDRASVELLAVLVAEFRQAPYAFNAAKHGVTLKLLQQFAMTPSSRENFSLKDHDTPPAELAEFMGSLQESDRYVRQIGTDTNTSHAASNDCLFLSSRSSPGPGRSPVSQA